MAQNREVVKILARATGWSYDDVKKWLLLAAGEFHGARRMTRDLVDAIKTADRKEIAAQQAMEKHRAYSAEVAADLRDRAIAAGRQLGRANDRAFMDIYSDAIFRAYNEQDVARARQSARLTWPFGSITGRRADMIVADDISPPEAVISLPDL